MASEKEEFFFPSWLYKKSSSLKSPRHEERQRKIAILESDLAKERDLRLAAESDTRFGRKKFVDAALQLIDCESQNQHLRSENSRICVENEKLAAQFQCRVASLEDELKRKLDETAVQLREINLLRDTVKKRDFSLKEKYEEIKELRRNYETKSQMLKIEIENKKSLNEMFDEERKNLGGVIKELNDSLQKLEKQNSDLKIQNNEFRDTTKKLKEFLQQQKIQSSKAKRKSQSELRKLRSDLASWSGILEKVFSEEKSKDDPAFKSRSSAGSSERVPSTEELVEVSKHITEKWKFIARFLKVDEADINAFDKDNDSAQEKAYKMLFHWQNEKGFSSATVLVLAKALKSAGLLRIAEDVFGIREKSEKTPSNEDEEIEPRPSEQPTEDTVAASQGESLSQDASIRRRKKWKSYDACCTIL